MEEKKVTIFTGIITYPDWQYTEAQLECDLNYYRAEKLTVGLLENALITPDQFICIMAENLRIFRPLLAEIL